MDTLVTALRAAAEPTRLRLVALCAQAELTVSELTQVLGQSQPRVSRHLKLLCEAGLLDRVPEGTWVFYSLADGTGAEAGRLARLVADLVPQDDPQIALDRARLEAVRAARAEAANSYFRANAAHWGRIRSLHVDEAEVERGLLEALPPESVGTLLDIGTGTGRILELFAPEIDRGVGVDLSRDMLSVARANLESAGSSNCQLRRADMYRLPFPDGMHDAVTIHQVLHYADDPAAVIAEASRILAPGGRVVIVDFAPHSLEELRSEHAHRRLGFSDAEVEEWFDAADLSGRLITALAGDPLTVNIWLAEKPGLAEHAVVLGAGQLEGKVIQ